MAKLPDPTTTLSPADRTELDHMKAVRGEDQLGQVYVRMWNNPTVARLVGQLGEHLRFRGLLPDDVRELAILHFARGTNLLYEWAHHQGPARAARIPASTIDAIGAQRSPGDLRPEQQAALRAVDAVLAGASIPQDVQDVLVDAYGTPGIVELVVLVGLYRLIGGVVTSFDIGVEHGLPTSFRSAAP